MKKKIVFILLSFLILVFNLSAQNYTKGYILKNNGEKLDGWIAYRTDRLNATECLFKSDLSSNSEKFYPDDIQEYRLVDTRDGEKLYISKKVNVESEEKNVFLDFLLQGEMNLYYYESDKQKYYLFEDEGGKMFAVSRNPEFVYQGADYGIYYGEDTKYKGFLKYQFKDYPKIAKMTDKTEFSHKSMIKLVKAYHDLTCDSEEECVVFSGKGVQSTIKVKFSVYGGANYISSFEVADVAGLNREFTMTKVAPVIGAQVNFYLPRLSNSVSVFVDVSMSNLKGEYSKVASEYDYTLKMNTLTFSTKAGLKYTYPKGTVRPMIEGGATYTALFNCNLDHVNNQTGTTSEREDQLRSGCLGVYFGAGVDFRLTKENFVFCRLSYEKDWYAVRYSHGAEFVGAKIGYTF